MRICIDPGHGMSNRQMGIYDPGATHIENGFKFQEAAVVLRYGLNLKDAFKARGIDVFMTRDDDTDHAPVGTRAIMAKNAQCGLFISLHLNDFDDDSANGIETLYSSPKGKRFAEILQPALVNITSLKDRNVKLRQDLAVLRFEPIAILIELGFIANDQDRATILNPQVRFAVSETIADVATSILSV